MNMPFLRSGVVIFPIQILPEGELFYINLLTQFITVARTSQDLNFLWHNYLKGIRINKITSGAGVFQPGDFDSHCMLSKGEPVQNTCHFFECRSWFVEVDLALIDAIKVDLRYAALLCLCRNPLDANPIEGKVEFGIGLA